MCFRWKNLLKLFWENSIKSVSERNYTYFARENVFKGMIMQHFILEYLLISVFATKKYN